MAMPAKAPKVSVCIVTYNHISFIGDCLQSIVSQETDFEYEIIVGDDASTDGASDIVREYAELYPNLINPVIRPGNIGASRNLFDIHNRAQGEFVVHLDGDDLALPGKLQQQYLHLMAHPDQVGCGHIVQILDQFGNVTDSHYPRHVQAIYDRANLILMGMPFAHSSLMYRRRCRIPREADRDILDWYIVTDLMRHGPVGLIPSALGAYRINPNSVTTQLGKHVMKELMMEMYCMRAADWPAQRRQFACVAYLECLARLRHGQPIGAALRKLLLGTWTLKALPLLVHTHRRRKANALQLRRGTNV